MADLIGARPRRPRFTGGALQHVLNAVLTYHHGESNRSEAGDHRRLIETINKHLEKIFFEQMFVLRPEVEDALRRVSVEPLCIIFGNRGTGKTTIIKYIDHLLSSDPGADHGVKTLSEETKERHEKVRVLRAEIRQDPDWYFYFDVEEHRVKLSSNRSVCDLIFDLVSTYAMEWLDDFEEGWRTYLRMNYQEAVDARTRIRIAKDEIASIGGSEEAAHEYLLEHLPRAIETAIEQFESEPGGFKLETLLEYLTSEFDIAPGFAVDNIDLFGSGLQDEVVRTMYHLAHTRKLINFSVVGARSENKERLIEVLAGHGGFREEDSVSVSLSESNFEVLAELLRLRLDLLPEILELPEVKEVHSSQLDSGYVGDDYPLSADSADTIRVLRGLLSPHLDAPSRTPSSPVKAYLEDLLAWHNRSLRSVAAAAYNLGDTVSSNCDPIYDFSTVRDRIVASEDDVATADQKLGRSIRNRIRFCRNLLIRQFVSLGHPADFAFNHPLLLFEQPEQPVADTQLPYLRFHILQLLNEVGGRLALGTLTDRLAYHGAGAARVKDSVRALGQRVGSDERGLVHLEGVPQEGDLPNTVVLHTLDAGRLLVRDGLAFKTDYVFWNAFNANNSDDYLSDLIADAGDSSSIASETVRIETALRYVERRVLPRFLGVWRLEAIKSRKTLADPAMYLSRYISTFGGRLAPIEMAREIRSFANKAPANTLDADFRNAVHKRVAQIERDTLQHFRDRGVAGELSY